MTFTHGGNKAEERLRSEGKSEQKIEILNLIKG
jgi:hypothetical protein